MILPALAEARSPLDLTPYPGTGLYQRIAAQGRLLHRDWERYDTRHAVFRPARMTPEELECGYRRAYRMFYRWGSIFQGAKAKPLAAAARHLAYADGWRKFEWVWHSLIPAETSLRRTARPRARARLGLRWADQGRHASSVRHASAEPVGAGVSVFRLRLRRPVFRWREKTETQQTTSSGSRG